MKFNGISKYILGIISVVALVGIFILVGNTDSIVAGQATGSATCTDTDAGFDYTTQGTISGGTWKTTGRTYTAKTDSCNVRGQLQEGFCSDSTHGFYVFKYCDRVVGTGYECEDGACVLGSCTENLYLGESLSECTYTDSVTFEFVQDDFSATSADNYLFIDSSPEVYLAEGSASTGIEFSSIENDDYETIELVSGTTSAELRFTNSDGTLVELPLAADSSSTSGEASDEFIYWGSEAPTSTTANQDELVYLEGETCDGFSSVVDCQGAMFLVIDSSEQAHLLQITNVDTSDNHINLDDLTYATTNDDMIYTDGVATTLALTSAGDIELTINESAETITFTTIGSSDGALITTEKGAILEIINTDLTSQTFEGLKFSEFNDGVMSSYLSDLELTAVYDDVTDNSIEIDLTSLMSLSSADGMGWFDESDVVDDYQLFETYKGTLLTYDREDQQSLVINHPENSVYAVVNID